VLGRVITANRIGLDSGWTVSERRLARLDGGTLEPDVGKKREGNRAD